MLSARKIISRPIYIVGLSGMTILVFATSKYFFSNCETIPNKSSFDNISKFTFSPEGTRCIECDNFMDMYGYDKCFTLCERCRPNYENIPLDKI